MAMTNEQRIRTKRVIHKLSAKDIMSQMGDYPNAVNESGEKKIRNLRELEALLEGKVLPYSEPSKLNDLGENINISLMFMSNKFTQVTPDNNLIQFGFNVPEDQGTCRVYFGSSQSVDAKTFSGAVTSNKDVADYKNMGEIVSLCDPMEIYNFYKPQALKIMKQRAPYCEAFYSQVYTFAKYKMSGEDSEDVTLFVYFDDRTNEYYMAYNPNFILLCALDEWATNKRAYSSFEGCYCYILAFLITHEMFHIIHQNTTNGVDLGDVGNHEVGNIMQDSFINCEISMIFAGVEGLSSSRTNPSPMPRVGIGSSITVRAEHNVGFKSWDSIDSLVNAVVFDVAKVLKVTPFGVSLRYTGNSKNSMNVTSLAGADMFITIDVNSSASSIRDNSNIFQMCLNTIMKNLTDGSVFSRSASLTEGEALTDLEKLPKGTLVRIKKTREICIVDSCDDRGIIYTLNKVNVVKIGSEDVNVPTETGETIPCVKKTPTYEDSGVFFHKLKRPKFDIVTDPSWLEASGDKTVKTELTDEEIRKMKEQEAFNRLNSFAKLVNLLGEEKAQEVINKLHKEYFSSPFASNLSDYFDLSEAELKEELYKRYNTNDFYNKVLLILSSIQNQGQSEGQQGDKPQIYRVGDIVWVNRVKSFGKIVEIKDGKFTLEGMEEIGVRVLDDAENHSNQIQEGVNFVLEGKMVLKERVFVPTGTTLGVFGADELETFDITYTESDVPQNQQSDGENTSNVPQPKDDNPIKPDSGNQMPQKNSGSNDSNKDNDDNNDPENGSFSSGGQDDTPMDDEDIENTPKTKGNSDDSQDSQNGSDSSDNQDSQNGSDSQSGSDGHSGSDNSDSQDGQSGSDSSDSSASQEGQNGSDSQGGSNSSNNPNGNSSKDEADGSETSKGEGTMDGSDEDDTDNGNVEDDTDDELTQDEIGSLSNESELAKTQREIEDGKGDAEKQREAVEKELAEERAKAIETPKNQVSSVNNREVSKVKDMLNKAQSQVGDHKDTGAIEGHSEVDMLNKSGAGSLSNKFSYSTVLDWKKNLERILDKALGFDIKFNPNLINKRIEDTIGTEFEQKQIKNIAVLLDYSSSMGAEKFEQVISQLDAMFMARNMNKVKFHLLLWGESNTDKYGVPTIASTYETCKGSMFKRTIMKHKRGDMGSTQLVPALAVISNKISGKFDAILILTDAQIFDIAEFQSKSTAMSVIANDFVRKYHKKMIWVLAGNHKVDGVKGFDPSAFAQNRVIIFKKG